MSILKRIQEFDKDQADALRRIWFVGDVHGEFKYVARSLVAAKVQPRWIVFVGDLDIDDKPFREVLEPVRRWDSSIQIAFIDGNHDADTHEHWEMLHDCGDAVPLHGKVVDMGAVRVAGLGGHFVGKVWYPPAEPQFMDQKEALRGGAFRFRGGERPAPKYLAAIYPDQVIRMESLRADIFVTHEAPSCHTAWIRCAGRPGAVLGGKKSFHGHHHDDRTQAYALKREQLGFDAVALGFCAIKNGLGEVIFSGEEGW